MLSKKINLKNRFNQLENDVELVSYCIDNSKEIDINKKRKTVIIFPGGGYKSVSFREGEPVALRLVADDINAFVVHYNVGPYEYPYPIIEGFAAIAYVREHAEEYHVDINQICVMGFSAGGHFAACLGAFHNKQEYADMLNVPLSEIKINGVLLGYPVITMTIGTIAGTRDQLLNNNPELKDYYSIEKQVDEEYPKTFIWTTDTDNCVDPIQTLMFANALKKAHVNFELHYYPIGPHGASLANEGVYGLSWKEEWAKCSSYENNWIDMAINFIKKII